MASLTQWTWVWASFGRWWKTRKTGALQSVHRITKSWTRLSVWITTHTHTHTHTHRAAREVNNRSLNMKPSLKRSASVHCEYINIRVLKDPQSRLAALQQLLYTVFLLQPQLVGASEKNWYMRQSGCVTKVRLPVSGCVQLSNPIVLRWWLTYYVRPWSPWVGMNRGSLWPTTQGIGGLPS